MTTRRKIGNYDTEAEKSKPPGVRVVTTHVENTDAIADMTLREISEKFGTVSAFREWVRAAKDLEEIGARRLKNAEKSGELISRELVEQTVFGLLDSLQQRLITEHPRASVRKLLAAIRSESPQEMLEQIVRADAVSHLESVRRQISGTLEVA